MLLNNPNELQIPLMHYNEQVFDVERFKVGGIGLMS